MALLREIPGYMMEGASCVYNTYGRLTPRFSDDEAVRAIYDRLHAQSNDVYLVSYPKAGHHLPVKLCVELIDHVSSVSKGCWAGILSQSPSGWNACIISVAVFYVYNGWRV